MEETPGEGLVSLLSMRIKFLEKKQAEGLILGKWQARHIACVISFMEVTQFPILFHLLSPARRMNFLDL